MAFLRTLNPRVRTEFGWFDLGNRLIRDRGAVMAEYGLLIAVVFLGVASAVAVFHDELIAFFSNAADTVANEGG